jgi:hypothetical protein
MLHDARGFEPLELSKNLQLVPTPERRKALPLASPSERCESAGTHGLSGVKVPARMDPRASIL